MSIKSDKWIERMSTENKMITPYQKNLIRPGVISYGVSSYGYDLRVANEYKILLTDQPDHGNPTVIDTHYFINSNTTITVKLLEAMATGNVVICLKSNEMESFIQHNHNGVLINSIDDLSNTIKTLENTPNKRVEIGNNARSHILENHSLENFIKKWKTAFSMVKSSFYTPDI